ncbi:hypothetical protein [uncultured Imperialibacter sp.]|uniref:hypothetical protein n=1 Tax=uncultured Imperialibacter sp. TaxID=1672639 RepID=UPI0030DC8902|tara:strand:- start:40487 stop:41608 length:1122 start_codon:yes stop_codon:yes gene_type:complete
MKLSSIIASVALCVFVIPSFAQTNTFPSSGNVGIGTIMPSTKLQVNGELTLERGADPYLFTSTSSVDQYRYVQFLNSVYYGSAAGIKAGGMLVADTYAYANPERNDLVVKGKIGIGTANPVRRLQVNNIIRLHDDAATHKGQLEFGLSDVFLENNPTGTHPGNVLLRNWNGTGYNDALFAKYDGNIGLGTTNPLNRLQIGPNPNMYNGNDLVVSNTNGSFAIHNLSSETYLWSYSNISVKPGGSLAIYAQIDGNVGIGTSDPDSKLTVKGVIHAEEVKVDLNVPGPDYVFEANYLLSSLEDTKAYIDQNKHLPGIPSSDEMQQNGVNLLEMNMKLLEKVEELTLHLIEQNKQIQEQQKRIEALEKTEKTTKKK